VALGAFAVVSVVRLNEFKQSRIKWRAMPKPDQTLYDVLGVKPDAKHHEIGIAFNRRMSERKREDAPPDPKGEVALREAFAVLSDLDRRAAYDRTLVTAKLKPAFGPVQGALAVVVIAAIGAGIWWFTVKKPADEASKPVGRAPAEIAAAATPAVGRLDSTTMSGDSKQVGIAFAIDNGVMVTSCHGIAPGALLTVKINPRTIPARVSMTDEGLGLCKLDVSTAGTTPLSISGTEARAGDTVYATSLNAVGEVVLKEGKVKRVAPAPSGKLVESTLTPAIGGAPLLDSYGRVVAVAALGGGEPRHVLLPASWRDAPQAPPRAVTSPPSGAPSSQPAEPGEAPSPYDRAVDPTAPRPPPTMPNAPGSMTPERVEKLHKAFRPPPNIPADKDP